MEATEKVLLKSILPNKKIGVIVDLKASQIGLFLLWRGKEIVRRKWLSTNRRTDLPMNLRKSLKVHSATADLSEHYGVIKALANGEDLPQNNTSESVDTLVSVDYPLRPDFMVSVKVPRDITRTESERLSEFIKTLFFE